jgi:hypothetical protein
MSSPYPLQQFRRWLTGGRKARPSVGQPRYRPALEPLETRTLLSTLAFHTAQTLPVGSGPGSVVAADVNGDGHPDLVVANSGNNTVSVLLGNGDGTFQAAQNFATGSGPSSLAVADVNGDGHLDIITGNTLENAESQDTVSVLLGNGNGTFQAAHNFATHEPIGGMAVADVSGDGMPDIVTTIGDGNTLSVFLGDGDGTFQAAQNTQLPHDTLEPPCGVVVADVNGDGRPDLVIGDNSLLVLLGNGNGTFQNPYAVDGDYGQFSVAVADVNGDGKPDIIGAMTSYESASVLLGNGDGTFQHFLQTSGYTPNLVASILVADMNGDGHPDLVLASDYGGGFSVLPGNGDGTFQPPQNFATGLGAYRGVAQPVAVADLNGDGAPDVVIANYGRNTVSVLLADQATQLQLTAPGAVSAGQPFDVRVQALNADGTVAANYTGTVHFTASESGDTLPTDYTFTAADQGVHTFSVQVGTDDPQTLTDTDTRIPALTGSAQLNPAAILSIDDRGDLSYAAAVSGADNNLTVSLVDGVYTFSDTVEHITLSGPGTAGWTGDGTHTPCRAPPPASPTSRSTSMTGPTPSRSSPRPSPPTSPTWSPAATQSPSAARAPFRACSATSPSSVRTTPPPSPWTTRPMPPPARSPSAPSTSFSPPMARSAAWPRPTSITATPTPPA